MEVGLGVAIAADPDFAPPYRLLAQIKVQRQDRAGAVATLDRALARGNAIPEMERARLELESAELSGNADARQAALSKLVKLDSGDAASWSALGATLMSRHDYRQAQQAYQKASELAPDDVGLLNTTGYAAGQAGDLDAATSALRRYAALRPNEPNPLDSMGDVNLANGRLSEAENFYLQSLKKDPNFENQNGLMKAALARLLSGDVPGANNLAERYLAARAEAKDPIVDYRRAQWSWISGRRKAAAQQMGAFALASGIGSAARYRFARLCRTLHLEPDVGRSRGRRASGAEGAFDRRPDLGRQRPGRPIPGAAARRFLGMGGARRAAVPRPRADRHQELLAGLRPADQPTVPARHAAAQADVGKRQPDRRRRTARDAGMVLSGDRPREGRRPAAASEPDSLAAD